MSSDSTRSRMVLPAGHPRRISAAVKGVGASRLQDVRVDPVGRHQDPSTSWRSGSAKREMSP